MRRQLSILKEFIEGFDFIRMTPDYATIKSSQIKGPGSSESLAATTATVRALAEAGKAYAIYVNSGTRAELVLELPAGSYKAEWANPKTGEVEKSETFGHAGGNRILISPAYTEDIALRLIRQ